MCFYFAIFLKLQRNRENSLASIRAYPRFKVEVLRASTNLLGPLENRTFVGKSKR